MNSVNLIGRVSTDIELKKTENGKSVVVFNLAVDRSYGENSKADFFPCVVWNEYADTMSKYLKKGQQIGVEGSLRMRSYDDKNGVKHYLTEIYVSNITLLGKKE